MYVYQGDGHEGSTIVNFGLSVNVTDGKAFVEYNGFAAKFDEVLHNGQLTSRDGSIQLDQEQLAWLEDSKTWVKHRLEDSA